MASLRSLKNDKLLRSDRFFSSQKTAKDGIFPRVAGYDIHYQFAEDEVKQATELREEVTAFIEKARAKNPIIHLTDSTQTDGPKGPWRKSMWELQISPYDQKNTADPAVLDPVKNWKLHEFMLQVVEYAKTRIADKGLKGSILVHGNVYPRNSDMHYEYEMHFKHRWLAHGDPIDLINVWKEYFPIEEQVKQFILKKGAEWTGSPEQKSELINKMTMMFGTDPVHGGATEIARKTRNVIAGQVNLAAMNSEKNKRAKDDADHAKLKEQQGSRLQVRRHSVA